MAVAAVAAGAAGAAAAAAASAVVAATTAVAQLCGAPRARRSRAAAASAAAGADAAGAAGKGANAPAAAARALAGPNALKGPGLLARLVAAAAAHAAALVLVLVLRRVLVMPAAAASAAAAVRGPGVQVGALPEQEQHQHHHQQHQHHHHRLRGHQFLHHQRHHHNQYQHQYQHQHQHTLQRLAYGRSFIALSADDFGRFSDSVPLQPDAAFMRANPALALATRPDWTPWYARATVETSADLRRLASFLDALNSNVTFEQRAVLTPHWVVGGPDFDAMRAAGCRPAQMPPTQASSGGAAVAGGAQEDPQQQQPERNALRQGQPGAPRKFSSLLRPSAPRRSALENASAHEPRSRARSFARSPRRAGPSTPSTCVYKERLLSDNAATGADQAPYHRGDLREEYLDLWKRGLWHPEYHGRSHFNVKNWLALLRTDPVAQRCFDANMVCASKPDALRSEFTAFSTRRELKTWLEGGVNTFSSFFGYRPRVMSSPHNAWTAQLADAILDLGFSGGEMAEDQEAYIPHSAQLGLHDRYRFDVFFPGFQCDLAIAEVVKLLRVPTRKSMVDRWYEFLSVIDLFRVHYRPYHHSPGGNHERFMSLMWHAQNMMSSTYSKAELFSHMHCLEKVVTAVRTELPRTAFVTVSELHQIRARGWSQEVWHDAIIVRNYGDRAVQIDVPDLRDLHWKSSSWRGSPVEVEILSSDEYVGADAGTSSRVAVARSEISQVTVGERMVVPADTVIRLRAPSSPSSEHT